MYLDSAVSVAYDAAKAAHFGPHPLGQSIIGTVASITDLTIEQMRAYFAEKYSPANIVLAFAGKADWGELVALATKPIARVGPVRPTSRTIAAPRGTGAFEALLRAEDLQQTVIGVDRRPAAGR